MWATMYFWTHEKDTLLPRYGNNLLLFDRYIDDMVGIWVDDGNPDSWDSFKRDTNTFGILTWEFEDLSSEVNFLDLTISIENNRIVTKTFQKPLNLYQYIPHHAQHTRRA